MPEKHPSHGWPAKRCTPQSIRRCRGWSAAEQSLLQSFQTDEINSDRRLRCVTMPAMLSCAQPAYPARLTLLRQDASPWEMCVSNLDAYQGFWERICHG